MIYNTCATIFNSALPLVGKYSQHHKTWVNGIYESVEKLKNTDFSNEDWYWFHAASLGEFEQAVPLIEALKNKKKIKIAVSFFSPSGYEQKKNHKLIDFVFYLPIDTYDNALLVINKLQPKKIFFVKYEFWNNYFKVINENKIPFYLVSAAFREDHIFFKNYGIFFKKMLHKVSHFFVQNKISRDLLKKEGFINVSISGDTRFDRVYKQLSMDNRLDFIENFIENRTTVVLGSTWADCENVVIDAINKAPENTCFIIAPHQIKPEKIAALTEKIKVKTQLFSKGEINATAKVLIVDAIGYLSKIYSYADIAYVGGAIGTTGLHNILEPAVFGMPILTGPNVEKFPEAYNLRDFGGLKIINTSQEFKQILFELLENKVLRNQMSTASEKFISTQIGATKTVMDYLENN